MNSVIPPGSYGFDEISVGDRIETASTTVSADTIDTFADLTGDRFEIHMSDSAAAAHGFDARVAHGLLVLSLIDGLKNQAPAQFKAQASLGWNWSFKAPVIAGDQVFANIVVAEKREIEDKSRGILRLEFEAVNQRGECVQKGENLLMVYR